MGQVTGGSAPAPREHSLLWGHWPFSSWHRGLMLEASTTGPLLNCCFSLSHPSVCYKAFIVQVITPGLPPQFSSLVLPIKATRWRCFTIKQIQSVLAPGPPQDAASWLFLPLWYPRAPLAPSTGYFCSQCQQGSPDSSPDPIPIPLFLQDCAQSICFCKLHLGRPASFTCS